MPKVSIVLPNYNYATYLDERIQSLLSQTYTDFELIILDDASKDNSIEIIQNYTTDLRIKTKFYSENSGLPYRRWNDGADLAQGEYILIAGADDSCHPTLLKKLVEKLDSYPSVGLAFSQSLEIDSDGERLRSLIEWTDDLDKERWKKDFTANGKEELKYILFKNVVPNASAVLMRRKSFIEAGQFDTNFMLSADYLLWIRMLMISDIAFVAEPLNYFRTHTRTVRGKNSRNGVELEELLRIRKYLVKCSGFIFPSESINKIWKEMKEVWFHLIRTSLWEVGLERNIKIYKVLSEVDPQIGKELFVKTFVYLLHLIRTGKGF